MQARHYTWRQDVVEHALHLAPVTGTGGKPYLFGAGPNQRPIEIRDFHIMTTPVTQALWEHVMGSNPAERTGPRLPVENVSWDHITEPGGFLERTDRMAPGEPLQTAEVDAYTRGGDQSTEPAWPLRHVRQCLGMV
jgi:formylglycine-generating enzyme required for sulfatase activity